MYDSFVFFIPDGVFHAVQILDTAGSLNFPAMRELSIRSGRGFILVFAVDNLQSFHEAIQLWDLIQRLRGHNVTVNGDRYRAIITNFFIPELNNHDVQELWFQLDGATCDTARATIDLLKDTFGDRLISRFGPVNWPPRSCDLTPLDYFLWGYVKSLVYADKPQTLDPLEDNIHRVIADIRPQMLEKVIENWTSRLDYIRASRGSPMPEIIFKM
ncbi:uncharacterized protein TNCV_371711 [Trichonephila clavipes]|nr:uncharacterized protein TNCV_371711 [Trichonephila clavipes]